MDHSTVITVHLYTFIWCCLFSYHLYYLQLYLYIIISCTIALDALDALGFVGSWTSQPGTQRSSLVSPRRGARHGARVGETEGSVTGIPPGEWGRCTLVSIWIIYGWSWVLYCKNAAKMRPKEEFDHPESCRALKKTLKKTFFSWLNHHFGWWCLHGLPFRSLRLEGVVSSSRVVTMEQKGPFPLSLDTGNHGLVGDKNLFGRC